MHKGLLLKEAQSVERAVSQRNYATVGPGNRIFWGMFDRQPDGEDGVIRRLHFQLPGFAVIFEIVQAASSCNMYIWHELSSISK